MWFLKAKTRPAFDKLKFLGQITKMKNDIEFLKKMAQTIDPFDPESRNQFYQELKELGLDTIDDPFQLTNALIKLIEDSIEKTEIEESHASPPR